MLRKGPQFGPIGLDIGACGLKVLQFSNQGPEPVVTSAVYQPFSVSDVDPTRREATIRKTISEALRRQPFRGNQVVTALGCREFQMKNIRLPRMPAEEQGQAIQFEAHGRIGTEDGEAQIRHIIAGEVRHGNELKDEIIVFAASNAVVQARLQMLESLKLKTLALDIAPCAVARCFFRFLRRAEDAQAVNVFMDVGWRGTSIVLTRGTELTFLKMIEIGGEHFTDAVAKALSIQREDAVDLRVRIMRETCGGRTGDKSSISREVCATVTDAVRPLLERISRDVQLCLRYFAVTFRGQRPNSLTVVGGEAHEPSLLSTIAESVDVPCTIGNPLRGLRSVTSMGGREQRAFQPAWTVASGLALRGSQCVQGLDLPQAGSGQRPAETAVV